MVLPTPIFSLSLSLSLHPLLCFILIKIAKMVSLIPFLFHSWERSRNGKRKNQIGRADTKERNKKRLIR